MQPLSLGGSRVSTCVTCVTPSVSSSFLSLPTSTTSTFPPQFTPNPHASTRPGAPPLSWGMWAQIKMSKLGPHCICPSPFQRDVGGSSSLDGGMGETQGGIWGGGGPFSASGKRTTTFIVVCFLHSFVHTIHLTASTQCQTTQRQSPHTIHPSVTPITHHRHFPNKPCLKQQRWRWQTTTLATMEPMAGRNYRLPREKSFSPGFPGSQWGKAHSGIFPGLLPRNFFTRLPRLFC